MKLNFTCRRCLNEKNIATLDYCEIESVELGDNYCYDYVCPNGHETKYVVSNPRYELLYDFGVSAYLDGYYREAVLDFAAALERFHEHAIFMMLGMGSDPKLKQFWNQIQKQSERQYGAYMALYLAKYNDCPISLSNKFVEFRNKVTHKGYFPSKEETLEYAQYVADYILAVSNRFPNDFLSRADAMYPAIQEMLTREGPYIGHTITTIIKRLHAGKTFDIAILQYQQDFDFYYSK